MRLRCYLNDLKCGNTCGASALLPRRRSCVGLWTGTRREAGRDNLPALVSPLINRGSSRKLATPEAPRQDPLERKLRHRIRKRSRARTAEILRMCWLAQPVQVIIRSSITSADKDPAAACARGLACCRMQAGEIRSLHRPVTPPRGRGENMLVGLHRSAATGVESR